MARKLIIENLMKLASEIGANPNKYMGTKTNINFLGTGDKAMKGTTFGSKLNDDFLNLGVSQNDLIKVVEQDMGYVTSGKLNDSQLKVMTDNLTMARDTLKPVPPTNLFDIATGTGNLNKKGLESLRGTNIDNTPTPLTDKISGGINRLKVQKTGFAKKDEVGDTPAQALDRGFMEAEGARRAVLRQALLKDENALKSLPDGVVDSLKNSKDLMGKANSGNDPLILFRAIYGDAIDVNKIDDIIASEPFGDVDSIANKVLAFLKQGDNFADGGRIGFKSGKFVKDGIAALLKLGNKKFGKDTIKTVENESEFFDNMEVSPYFNIKRPEAAIRRDQFKNFGKPGKFNEDGTIDYDYYAQILNDAENDFVTGGESIEKLEKMLKARLDEQAYMYDQFITGKLDPKKGESGRESFLQKKLDEVESSGDRRLITLEELDELDELKGGPGRPPGFTERKSRVPKNIPVEMMTEDLLLAKYPGISERLARLIGNDKNLQRKAEAIAEIEQTLALQESGKSVDEVIEIMKREPKTKMKSGGLARILEM
jgi:hypothetical protein